MYKDKLKALKRSEVIFDKEEHSYSLGNKQLRGITGIIKKHFFPTKYKDVPPEILKAAAERGSLIHEEIENYIMKGEFGFTDEFNLWKEYTDINGGNALSEFLVDDGENIATAIDIVHCTPIGWILRDVKTTYTLDKEYLSWQLSILAYLFERQTGEKVSAICADWIKNGVFSSVQIDRKSDEEIEKLLKSEFSGEIYTPEGLVLAEDEIACVNRLAMLLTGLKEQEQSVKDMIKLKMLEQGLKKAEIGNLQFTYIASTARQSFDSKLFEKEHPEIYCKYIKTSNVSDSVRIKVLNEG